MRDTNAPPKLIMILGSGRSGTTWLAKLLDSCPDVMYLHEPDSTNKQSGIPYLPSDHESEEILDNAKKYLNSLFHNKSNKTHGKRPFFKKKYRSNTAELIFRSSIFLSKLSERLGIEGINVITAEQKNTNVIRVIKSVDSVSRAGLFLQSTPNIKVVHLVRNPFAVVDSRLRGSKLGLMPDTSYFRDLFEAYGNKLFDITLEELNDLSIEAKFTYEWMVHNHHILANYQDHDNYIFVGYDKLALDLKNELVTLFEKLQLPWSEQTDELIKQMLISEKNQGDYFGVMRSPKQQLNKWKENLSSQQINDIGNVLANSDLLNEKFNAV